MNEITGIIDHRILLNYRVDPQVIQRQLPIGFKPKLVNGSAIAGICQISVSDMRPQGLPAIVATRSHNIAHRVAVTTSNGEGVYVFRRDTDSWLNVMAGGRLFPGVYQKAGFKLSIKENSYNVHVKDSRGKDFMIIKAVVTEQLPSGSIFRNKDEVSQFFQGGSIGWSPRQEKDKFDAIELETMEWNMEPMLVDQEFSAFFTNQDMFPRGSVEFDSAVIVRNLKHSWVSRESLCNVCG